MVPYFCCACLDCQIVTSNLGQLWYFCIGIGGTKHTQSKHSQVIRNPIFNRIIFQPLTWEWIWLAGTIGIVLFGLYAMKTSKATNIKIYMILVLGFGFLPVGWCKLKSLRKNVVHSKKLLFGMFGVKYIFFCKHSFSQEHFWVLSKLVETPCIKFSNFSLPGMVLNFSDLYAYIYEPQSKLYQTWKGLPVSILWYIFAIVALNVHVFEMHYAVTLKNAWAPKRKMNW